jgi:UDP-GlcNAc3NAcA epimerase
LKKVLSVIGARPQFIKHVPVLSELQKRFNAITVHTGQHYDENMSDIFFNDLLLPRPEFRLTLSGKTHAEQTGEMMVGIERILLDEKPDFVLVYGDTNSTLAAALAAAKLCIPVIHVESGLRSYNMDMPEEVNRIVTDHTSKILFCPDNSSQSNLLKEGISKNVYVCGDVMKDMVRLASPYIKSIESDRPYVFATIHRPYNTDDQSRMVYILDALNKLDYDVIFPMHPRTVHKLKQYNIDLAQYSNIRIVEPMGYFESMSYQQKAHCVITDSGGMQKEAYWLRRRCITLRTETEWTDTLQNDWNVLLFDDLSSLKELVDRKLPETYDENLYGDGYAAQKIVDVIYSF